jgi:transcriptional regulator with XRE-family HTH domain
MKPMTLGEKIKQLRKEKGYSQTFLEKRSGVNSRLLSKYENGRIIPTADTLRKIVEGLDISAFSLSLSSFFRINSFFP